MVIRKKHTEPQPKLKPLSPVHDLGMEDRSYAACKEYLDEAFVGSDFKNIALSGNFGAGKSSILHSYDKHRNLGTEKFLYISLTDFQNYGCDCKNKESAPENEDTQGKKPENQTNDTPKKDSVCEDPRHATQQRVEYSLLCQILTRCQKKNHRDSSLRGVPEAPTSLSTALFGGFFAALVFVLIFHERFGLLAKMFPISDKCIGIIHSGLYVLTAVMGFFLVLFCLRRGKVQKIALKSTHAEAEMALAQSQTSLDLYKFELVYTLKQIASKIDYTVVFEDMDRLDPQICVAVITKLRDLNTMVNARQSLKLPMWSKLLMLTKNGISILGSLPWLKGFLNLPIINLLKKGLSGILSLPVQQKPHIRFIYAVGDDILDRKLRPKFYDCIIPVTPALNLINAEDILCGILKENHVDFTKKKTWQTVKAITPYLNDYRTLRTLSNEFRILRSQFEGFTDDMDSTHASMLALTFYKVMVPLKYSQMFDEVGICELPEVTVEDFPEIKNAEYREKLATVLNHIRPPKNMLQLLYLTRNRLCARWIAALQDGPRERTMDAINEFYDNKLVDISAEIIANRIFEKCSDSGISTSLASYIYRNRSDNAAFDNWFYAPGNPDEHKFTNCMAYLTMSGQTEVPIELPSFNVPDLFDWCIKGLQSLPEDIGHESRWNKEMTGLLENILSTDLYDFSEEMLDMKITEDHTLYDLISWDGTALDEEANEISAMEAEMLDIVNQFLGEEELPREHITQAEFADFCIDRFYSGDDESSYKLSGQIMSSHNIDISQELIDNEIIEHANSEFTSTYLIWHLWEYLSAEAFASWFFQLTDPEYEKFAKCVLWQYLRGFFHPEQLFDWCLENLEVFTEPNTPRFCWGPSNMDELGRILRTAPDRVPEHLKEIVLYDDISIGDLLKKSQTEEVPTSPL